MCEQCLTEMLTIYSQEDNGQHIYIGIARKKYWDDYVPGDIMIGYCNGPDVVLKDDLFTSEDWNLIDEDKEAWHLRNKNEDHPADRFLDEEDFWSSDIQHIPFIFIPEATLRLYKHFGSDRPEDSHNFPAWVVTKVSEIFQEREIPLTKEDRLEWANQFPIKIDSISFEENDANLTRFVNIYVPVEEPSSNFPSWEEKSFVWPQGEDMPDEVKNVLENLKKR